MLKKTISIVVFILIWHIVASSLHSRVLPLPHLVFIDFFSNLDVLGVHALYSFRRLFIGILLAIAVGAPIGVLLGYFNKLNEFLSPIVYLFAPMPKVAFLPLVMLFLGIGDSAKIFLIFFIMLFHIIITLRDAVTTIPEELYASFLASKCSRLFILRHIVLPAISPGVFTSLRLGIAIGTSVLFIAETYGTVRGLGFYMFDSWGRLNYVNMYASIVAIGLMGFSLTFLVDYMYKKICPWDCNR